MFFSLWQYHYVLRKHLSWTSRTEAWLSKSLVCCSLNSTSGFVSEPCIPGATPSQSLNMTGILTWAHSYRTQEHSEGCPWLQDSQVSWSMSLEQHCRTSCSHTTFPLPSTQIPKLIQFQPFLLLSQFSLIYSFLIIKFCPHSLSWHLFLRGPRIIQSYCILYLSSIAY